ncbi:MAG: autoinducer 2-degrading protein [Bacillariaceae sp.]
MNSIPPSPSLARQKSRKRERETRNESIIAPIIIQYIFKYQRIHSFLSIFLTMTTPTTSFGATTPFILIARCQVKAECLDAYLEAAKIANQAVKESDTGTLHHTFNSDPDDPCAFVWSEVYRDDASLLFHLTNPGLQAYLQQHGELGESLSLEVYGTLSDETKESMNGTGFPVKFFDTKFGYSRVNDSK